MKIQKKNLLEALKLAKPFTDKDTPITATVMLDGPAQMIVATDLSARIEIPIEIEDWTREVTITSPAPALPGEALVSELNALKVADLKVKCDEAGLPHGKKAEMVDALFQKAKTDAENAEPEPVVETIEERLVVGCEQLLRIVGSLEVAGEEFVVLDTTEVERLDELFETTVTKLSVGGHFQNIEVHPPADFPGSSDFNGTNIGEVSGAHLARVALGSARKIEDGINELFTVVAFDRDNDTILATDKARLHVQKTPLKGEGKLFCDAKHIKAIGAAAKGGNVKIAVSDDLAVMAFGVETVNIFVKADDDLEFPQWTGFLNREGESTVTVEYATLKKLFKQAGVVAEGGVILTFNGSLNAQAQNEAGVRYERHEIPYTSGKVAGTQELSLDLRFLSDALSGMDEKVTIGVVELEDENDSPQPLRFTDGEGFNAVVMPRRM